MLSSDDGLGEGLAEEDPSLPAPQPPSSAPAKREAVSPALPECDDPLQPDPSSVDLPGCSLELGPSRGPSRLFPKPDTFGSFASVAPLPLPPGERSKKKRRIPYTLVEAGKGNRCPTAGCSGLGHITGLYEMHFAVSGCPLAHGKTPEECKARREELNRLRVRTLVCEDIGDLPAPTGPCAPPEEGGSDWGRGEGRRREREGVAKPVTPVAGRRASRSGFSVGMATVPSQKRIQMVRV